MKVLILIPLRIGELHEKLSFDTLPIPGARPSPPRGLPNSGYCHLRGLGWRRPRLGDGYKLSRVFITSTMFNFVKLYW